MTYNGYPNYETWVLRMYLEGNYTGEGTYREILALAEEYASDPRDDSDVYRLADALKDYVETELDLGDTINGLAADLIGAALSEVDWQDLAKNELAELAELAVS